MKKILVFVNSFNYGGITSLIQDIYDPTHYYIAVYDNNYPGMKRFVDVKCNKKACLTVSNGIPPIYHVPSYRVLSNKQNDISLIYPI